MKRQYPVFGPAFFMSFIFIGVMILLNMFLAIIGESYAKVKEEMEAAEPELMLGDYVNMKYGKLADKVKTKRTPLMDADEILRMEEVMVMDEVSFSVWRKEMKASHDVVWRTWPSSETRKFQKWNLKSFQIMLT